MSSSPNFKYFINLTNNIQELYSYNNQVDYFENCINIVLQEQRLLRKLNYTIEPDIVRNDFRELSRLIKEKIGLNRRHAKLSLEKIRQFHTSTNQIITQALDEYQSVNNSLDFDNVDKKVISSINGEKMFSFKSSFIDDENSSSGFDRMYAEHIVHHKIKCRLPNSFFSAATSKYLIPRKNVLEALDRIIPHTRDIVIVGVNLSIETIQLIEGSRYKFILTMIKSSDHKLNDTCFILNKHDLPRFESRELTREEIDKFHLKEINNKYKIYSNVIDLNSVENTDLKSEYSTTDDDSEPKVLILIAFRFLIKWKLDRKIVMLSLASQYHERGIPNNIEDLTQISSGR